MTFTEIVNNVAEQLNIVTAVGITRIGKHVNRRYKRLTSSLGLLHSRRTIQEVAFTLGVRKIVIPGVEKVISVQDLTTDPAGPARFLDEISYEEMLVITPRTDRPTLYAIESITSHTVTLLTDFSAQEAFEISVEGESQATTLSGILEPAFNESFHDILEFGAKADELRKMEKVALARDAENDFERRLSELRLHLAVSSHQDIVQGKDRTQSHHHHGGGGGGSAPSGSSSYTQTGLITFDRGSGVAPFAIDDSDAAKVANLDADKLDGQTGADYHDAALLVLTDVTTNDVTSTKHGFAPKSPADATKFLNGAATPAYALVKDSDLSTTDVTTNNVSSTKHGFVPKATNDTGNFLRADAAYGVAFAQVCQGRLTLTSALPVTVADVTGATTIYFALYGGNRIALFDGTYWKLHTFTERSLALGTLTSGLPYDVFIYDNAGTITLEFLAWTNGTTRATALVLQDGVLSKTGVLTRRYLGTFYTTSTTTTEDSFVKRYLWNYYHRVSRAMRAVEGTDTWTYTLATIRQARASTANQLNFVIGWPEVMLHAHVAAAVENSAANVIVAVGIGLDSTTANATGCLTDASQTNVANIQSARNATLDTYVTVGVHFAAWLEYSAATGTSTWKGDNGTPLTLQSGISGFIDG